jgi:lipopolysaccharide/colanic/teichoic acid biosynthesis glycosyltransferase
MSQVRPADLLRLPVGVRPGSNRGASVHPEGFRALVLPTLVTLDVLAFIVVAALVSILTGGSGGLGSIVVMVLAAAVPALAAFAAVGLYPSGAITSRRETLTVLAVGVAAAPFAAFGVAIGSGGAGPTLVGVVVTTIAALPLVALFRRGVRRLPDWGEPTAIIGTPPPALASDSWAHMRRLGLRPVPVVAAGGGARTGVGRVRHALVTVPTVDTDALIGAVHRYGHQYASLLIVPEPSAPSAGSGVLVRRDLSQARHRHAKRMLDLLLVIPAGVIALPVVLLCALAILVVSRGSPFYFQVREGRGGRPFRVWKLRTMYPNAQELLEQHLERDEEARIEWATKFKLIRDPRILPGIGTLLRRTSFDELPQLWNIFLGEMSFIGPRPFPDYHLAAFDEAFVALRRTVTPGLTGLWQISGRADGDLTLQKELDSYYVMHGSVWLDIVVLMRTPLAVLRGRGAY